MAVGIEKKNEKKVRKLWKRYWKSNGKKTKEIITELAVLGDAYAQYSIGYDIAFPKGISDDDIKNLRNAATKENLKKAYYYFDNATQKNAKTLRNYESSDIERMVSQAYIYANLGNLRVDSIGVKVRELIEKYPNQRNHMIAERIYGEGIGCRPDYIKAFVHSYEISHGDWWGIALPDDKDKPDCYKWVEKASNLPVNNENIKYGPGLISTVLLKKGMDLYEKDPKNPEAKFWLQRALIADPDNWQAKTVIAMTAYNDAPHREYVQKQAKDFSKDYFSECHKYIDWLYCCWSYVSHGESHHDDLSTKLYNELSQEVTQVNEMSSKASEYRYAQHKAKQQAKQARRQAALNFVGALLQTAGTVYAASQGIPVYNTPSFSAFTPAGVPSFSFPMISQTSGSSWNFWDIRPFTAADEAAKIIKNNLEIHKDDINTYYQFQGALLQDAGYTSNDNTNNGVGFSTNAGSAYQKDCHLCHGLTRCWTCNGEHRYKNHLTGQYVTCPNCGPDGLCRACGGTGKK